jgi:hypothetical protein
VLVPFIRYTRDKRGYEVTYVMHGYRPTQGPGRTRVLYFFRSPAHVRVGRRVLDEEAREALTHTHPDLTFDWHLLNESPPPRDDDRSHVPANRRPARREPSIRPPVVAAPIVVAVVDDQSVLGRVLGASEAAALRQRYRDLLDRILRRARMPEDRDRLSERAERLNPDEWPDEAAIRLHVKTVEAEMGSVLAELPQRRRGRRGGRRRQGQPDAVDRGAAGHGVVNSAGSAGGSDESGAELGSSAIIDGSGEPYGISHEHEHTRADRARPGRHGDDGTAARPGSEGAAEEGRGASSAAGGGLPDDDELS